MKKTKKIFAVLLTLAMMLVFIPTTALAETEPGIAMVTISNNTFAGGEWTGDYLSAIVEITPGMTQGDAVKAACDEAGVSVTGATVAEGGFISDIDGLSNGDGGIMSGWMSSVNNWFNIMGLSDPVEDGDWISVQYSLDFGGDLGSIFFPIEDANNKTLQALEFDAGSLEPAFDSDTHDYKLTLPAGTDTLFVLPLAFNLNYQVRTSVDGTVFKLMDGVPVADGTVITIVCGDPTWPTMNNGGFGTGAEDVAGETYTVTVALEAAVDNGGGEDENGEPEVVVTQDNSPETGDNNTLLLLSMIASLSALAAAGVVLTARKKAKQ